MDNIDITKIQRHLDLAAKWMWIDLNEFVFDKKENAMLQYEFTRKNGETKLTSICEITPEMQKAWPDVNFSGSTLYQRLCPMPANEKQPPRPLTEYWYATTDKIEKKTGGLIDAVELLTNPPFTRSVNEKGEPIEPVILPIGLSKADDSVWE